MEENTYRHFTVIVAGDDPDKLMETYNNNIKVSPYIIYKFSDADVLKQKYLDIYKSILLSNNIDENTSNMIKSMIFQIENENSNDFFVKLTENYEHDPKTNDAISTKNPNGKWTHYQIGKNLSIPFILKNTSEEVFTAKKYDIDWEKLHLFNNHIYEITWDMVMNGKKPSNAEEEIIYKNMKERIAYFKKFNNKENYVITNSSFWAYAFLSEKTGWVELNDNISQFDWIKNYYNNFIVPIANDTKLTIYECI